MRPTQGLQALRALSNGTACHFGEDRLKQLYPKHAPFQSSAIFVFDG